MTDAEIAAQVLSDADELEFTFGSQYPAGSEARAWFQYCAAVLRKRFLLTEKDKLDIALKTLDRCQPCTKDELVERMDFSRDEGRRILDLGIQLGVIQTDVEVTGGRGRPRVLLTIP